jgi:hypothetical protein
MREKSLTHPLPVLDVSTQGKGLYRSQSLTFGLSDQPDDLSRVVAGFEKLMGRRDVCRRGDSKLKDVYGGHDAVGSLNVLVYPNFKGRNTNVMPGIRLIRVGDLKVIRWMDTLSGSGRNGIR